MLVRLFSEAVIRPNEHYETIAEIAINILPNL